MRVHKGSEMSRLNTILSSLHATYGDRFNEALDDSFSLVMHHANERSIGVISAYRAQDHTDAENRQAHRNLVKDVRASGYGYTHVHGMGQEEGGTVSSEPSLLVIGREGDDKGHLKKTLTKLGNKYKQFGIMHKQYGELNAKFVNTTKDEYGKEEDLGEFRADDSTAQYYTKLKGSSQFSYSQDKKKEGLDVAYTVPKGFFVRKDYFYGNWW